MSETCELELASSMVCPFAQRSRIALFEKGVPFNTLEIEYLGDSFDKPQWFLDLAPDAKVPVLKHAGNVIYESDVINEYLDEVFPDPSLMPADPIARAKVRIWIAFANAKFIPSFFAVLMSQERDHQEFHNAKFSDRLRFMEQEGMAKLSKDGPFWLGQQVTLADISFYPFFERFCVLAHYRDFAIPPECGRLKSWLQAMRERPSVMATRETDAFHIEVTKNYAAGTQKGDTAKEMRSALV